MPNTALHLTASSVHSCLAPASGGRGVWALGLWNDEMKSKKPLSIPWTHHRGYYRLALENWRRIQDLKAEHDAIEQTLAGKKSISDDDAIQLAVKNDAIGELALVVVIFCAFTLEAYINHYGINRLSKNYHTKYLDKLDVVAKWVVIPRLVTGKELGPGSRAVQDLSWLVGLRNKLAHYKTKLLTLSEIKTSDFLWYEDAEHAIRTVERIMADLKSIDHGAEADWVGSGERPKA